jgi:3-phosphoshikimate 1-carboxyvinyltransferase
MADQRLRARPAGPLGGTTAVPGDKSISHRSLILAALAVGRSHVSGLLEGEDVLATAGALTALGVGIARTGEGRWRVDGVGIGGLAEPSTVLDLGNAGTGARLLLGVLAGQPFVSFVTGDASLNARPMARVIAPLGRMGAVFTARSGDRLPLAVLGSDSLVPIEHRSKVASAQVKSAVLLAGLHAPGRTSVVEPQPSRDHTERMLAAMGAELESGTRDDGTHAVAVRGQPELAPTDVAVPGDPSSAAFPVVAAAIRPGSHIRIEGVCTNPLRTGLYETLLEMGARLRLASPRTVGGEPVADIEVEGGSLKGVTVPAARAPTMIDEYPVLAVAAAFAEGTTIMHGLAELRVKESDRLAAVADGLTACGASVTVEEDTLIVEGRSEIAGGAAIDARLDHRIAMSFLVLGGATRAPVTVDGAAAIETSFPGFRELMNGLGARIEVAEAPA